MRRVGGDPVTAVLGPCIHPGRYEFGADLLDRLVARFGPEVAGRTDDGRPALDVPAGVRAALAAAGVTDVLGRRRLHRDVARSLLGAARGHDRPSGRRRGARRMSSEAAVDAAIVEAVAAIRARIGAAAARAGRDPAEVTLVAATKTVPVERVAAVVAAGVVDIGENRAQELTAKAPALEGTGARWHFLGQLQRNKVRALAPWVVCWQSVDREELGAEIAPARARSTRAGRGEPGGRVRQGWLRGRRMRRASSTRSEPVGSTSPASWRCHRPTTIPAAGSPRLRELGAHLGLAELSMGMSGDFEIAVEEGATMVRVGRALFGARS